MIGDEEGRDVGPSERPEKLEACSLSAPVGERSPAESPDSPPRWRGWLNGAFELGICVGAQSVCSPRVLAPFRAPRVERQPKVSNEELRPAQSRAVRPASEANSGRLLGGKLGSRVVPSPPGKRPLRCSSADLAVVLDRRERLPLHPHAAVKMEVPAADDCVHFQTSENDGGNSDCFITSVTRVDDPVASIDLCDVKEHELSSKRCKHARS